MTIEAINPEVVKRIEAVADKLYEAVEREHFPKVDAVRREAKADMNTTSAVMKEWRRKQTASPAPVIDDLPEEIKAAALSLVSTLWKQSQDIANDSLNKARQSWEAERLEMEEHRAELSEAFDTLESELKDTNKELDQVNKTAEEAAAAAAKEIDGLTLKVASQSEAINQLQSDLSKSQAVEAEKSELIAELRAELASEKQRSADLEKQHTEAVKIIKIDHKDELTAKANELTAALDENKALIRDLAGSEAKAKENASRIDELKEQVKQQASELNTINKELGKAQAEADTLADKLQECEANLLIKG